jgi:ABC-2 type transport system ATP-binding protein
LLEHRDKEITALSKGMRQRLCLAKTLLHDPRVMILDEPAAGLDPRARIELRDLVTALAGAGKAILISSHILSELAEMCSSVAILERGELKAAGTIGDLRRKLTSKSKIALRPLGELESVLRFLLEQPNVVAPEIDAGVLRFAFDGDESAAADLLARAIGAGIRVVDFGFEERGLEQIFLDVTEGKVQ